MGLVCEHVCVPKTRLKFYGLLCKPRAMKQSHWYNNLEVLKYLF